jgi:hypothetical protein
MSKLLYSRGTVSCTSDGLDQREEKKKYINNKNIYQIKIKIKMYITKIYILNKGEKSSPRQRGRSKTKIQKSKRLQEANIWS